MKNKLLSFSLKYILPVIVWLSVWQVLSVIEGNQFILPGIPATLRELCKLFSDSDFYIAVLMSSLRVVFGLLSGIFLGILLALLCHLSKLLSSVLLPLISVIKATPIASFIILAWVKMSGDALSIFIGFLMVLPIITQSTLDALNAVDKELSEVADVFEFSRLKRFKLLTLPTLKSFLAPAVITATGLAWKAEIAAEIIAYTSRSIGQGINDAKYDMNTARVFAWTVIIICFSLLLEAGIKALLGRMKNEPDIK